MTVASSNQWREKTGVSHALGRVIDHPDFSGFVTFADLTAVEVDAYMIVDGAHSGFVTPDSAANSGADIVVIAGGFATPIGS